MPMNNLQNNYFIRNYFFVTSIFMLLLSLFAFSDNLIYDVKQKSNSDPKFIIHALFCFAWFIMLVVQSGFIRKNNYKSHIRWGVGGMIAALGMFITSVYIFVVIFKGWDAMPFFVKANRILMFSFAICIWLGYRFRKNPILHKRFIQIGTFFIIGPPILDRLSDRLNIDNVDFVNALVPNLLFISLFIYDWRTLKKIHTISWFGLLWLYCIWAIAILSSEIY